MSVWPIAWMAVSLLMLGYVYAGYPALLRLVVAIRGTRRVARQPATPTLTLVISVFGCVDRRHR